MVSFTAVEESAAAECLDWAGCRIDGQRVEQGLPLREEKGLACVCRRLDA